jgi:hypothetical protein
MSYKDWGLSSKEFTVAILLIGSVGIFYGVKAYKAFLSKQGGSAEVSDRQLADEVAKNSSLVKNNSFNCVNCSSEEITKGIGLKGMQKLDDLKGFK